jgi:phage gp36-like protein
VSYGTITDVFARYKPIRTLVGSEDLQVSSADVASIFIADAESLVDAYLRSKYTVPLAPVPAYITMVTIDIAIYNMLLEHLPNSPDFFQPRYDRAMKILTDISSGVITVSSATIAASGDQDAWSTTQTYHPVFSPVLPPDDQTVDKDRVDADEALRSGDIGASS